MNAVTSPFVESPAPGSGDPSALVTQLGLPMEPGSLPDSPVGTRPEFRLSVLRDELLCGMDWPIILRAAELARLGHHRELLDLDQSFGARLSPALAKVSCCVGHRQLSRLRALRDHRVIQRYLDAVESGRARGWNPVVYGIVLSVFGVPFRQGLVHYAAAILRSHAGRFGLDPSGTGLLLDEALAPLPAAANRLLDSRPDRSRLAV